MPLRRRALFRFQPPETFPQFAALLLSQLRILQIEPPEDFHHHARDGHAHIGLSSAGIAYQGAHSRELWRSAAS